MFRLAVEGVLVRGELAIPDLHVLAGFVGGWVAGALAEDLFVIEIEPIAGEPE